YRNLLITMLLGGLWHGAAWNFVLWGAYHGSLLAMHRAWSRNIPALLNFQSLVKLRQLFSIALMFLFILYGWLLFRASSFEQIKYFTTNFNFTPSEFSFEYLQQFFFFLFPLLLMQIWQYRSDDLLIILKQKSWWVSAWLAFLISWLLIFGVREQTEFIYFQF
ncbi:MAG: MBOAT family protein, partial [Saprospiraceae bacterium]